MNDAKLAELREKYKNRNLREELSWGAYANHNGYTGKTNAEFLNWLCNAADRRIKELEERWIPCSERLPKDSGFYLVSTTDCITIMEFCKGWISQNIGSCNWYVKAWMPLPKPYKAEKEDEE